MKIINSKDLSAEIELIGKFIKLEISFFGQLSGWLLGWSRTFKDLITKLMYRQRGRFSQTFVNISMAGLTLLALIFSGKIEELIVNKRNGNAGGSSYLILAESNSAGAETQVSNLPKGDTYEYRVKDGDTVSSIAQQFGVSIDTIIWENNLKAVDAIKPNQIIKILPVTGVRYTVRRGETIYSIAKNFQVDPQNIIDYPFNTFSDDEKFSLTAGQELIIPDGIKPDEKVIDTSKYLARSVAPIPGVVGEGSFIWPTTGVITQKFSWYHQAVDIANPSNPDIVASQGGTVVEAGWNGGGYGNFVVIDHGNGYKTLYGHMLNNSIIVQAGQRVRQGQKIGVMGSTGRSTGTHCHFEIRKTAGGFVDPLSMLR